MMHSPPTASGSPTPSASATASTPLGSQKGTAPPKRQKMKKRVYVFAFLLCALVFYSVYSEGRVGIVASVKGLSLLVGLWLAVWFLFLKDIPAYRNFFSVIFQVTEDADKRPRAPKRVVVFE